MIDRDAFRRRFTDVHGSLVPTPLTPFRPSDRDRLFGVNVWLKRDDLTGVVGGGNKARKLDYLIGDAVRHHASTLVTVGAAQSNHCRATAAYGAMLGLNVHLILGGNRPDRVEGNQLLSELLGAQLHFTGADDRHWGELEIARERLVHELTSDGGVVYSIPVGGSTPLGALGYLEAFLETMEQCAASRMMPAAIVHTSSSGGTHAGLLAGRAAWRSSGRMPPEVVAIGAARGVLNGMPDIAQLANQTLQLSGLAGEVTEDDVVIDGRWLGEDYGVPSPLADDAIRWARRHGLMLDRVYTGKGFAGLLGNIAERRWGSGAEVVFIHTGGLPSVFATGGAPGPA